MATTKSDLVRSALSKLGVVGYDYDIDPEELRGGLIALEEMMTDWAARGICTGYALAEFPEAAQGGDDSETNPYARKAIVYSLAVQLADSYGKQITQTIAAGASSGMTSLLVAIQQQPASLYPRRMPRGSGNHRHSQYDRFYRQESTLTGATTCYDPDSSLPETAVANELVVVLE